MKAVLLTKIGTAENIIYKSIDTPHPAKNEALVKVKYCGLNHLDLLIREGKRPGPKSFPHILGSEIVGYVERLGNYHPNFMTGDKVTVYPWTFCGKCRECLTGNENICDKGGTIGRTCWGGYAQYAIVPIKNLIKLSNKLSLDKVCASTLVATTAYHLIEKANIKDKTSVLITGATGGVGTALIQLLKSKKCRIVCSSSHINKWILLRKLGVDYIVATDKLKTDLRKIYPNGLDYIVDIMGGNIWSDAVELLAKNGTMVFCATTLDGMGIVNIGSAFSKQINILGSYGGRLKDLKAILRLIENNSLHPPIDSIFPLEKATEALIRLSSQKAFGKILLRIN